MDMAKTLEDLSTIPNDLANSPTPVDLKINIAVSSIMQWRGQRSEFHCVIESGMSRSPDEPRSPHCPVNCQP